MRGRGSRPPLRKNRYAKDLAHLLTRPQRPIHRSRARVTAALSDVWHSTRRKVPCGAQTAGRSTIGHGTRPPYRYMACHLHCARQGSCQAKQEKLDHESGFFEKFKRRLDSQTSHHIAQASCTSDIVQSSCNITSGDRHGTWALHAPSTCTSHVRSDRERATPRTPPDPYTIQKLCSSCA